MAEDPDPFRIPPPIATPPLQGHEVDPFVLLEFVKRKLADKEAEYLAKFPGQKTGKDHAIAGGVLRPMSTGAIYYQPHIGAHFVFGQIYEKYVTLGGPAGPFGFPLSDTGFVAGGSGLACDFQGGSILAPVREPAFEVHGAIRVRYREVGGAVGKLGFPTSDESPTSDGGRFNTFQHGAIYWHPTTGAWDLSKATAEAYLQAGAERSFLGYPVGGDEWPNVFSQRGFIHEGASPAIIPFSVTWESGPIPTDAPISASVKLLMNSNGFWSYEGHFHNSGAIGLTCKVASSPQVHAPDGGVVVATDLPGDFRTS